MLTEIVFLKRRVNLNIDGRLYPIHVNDYQTLLLEFHLRQSDRDFLKRYLKTITKFYFKGNGNLKDDIHITDVVEFKTFDRGHAKVSIHKWDGDYVFEFSILNETLQAMRNIQNFEELFANDILAAQLF